MIQAIITYRDLEKFLSTLTDEQKDQAIKLNGADMQTIQEEEIAEEDYLDHKTDKNLHGEESEVKAMLDMANLPFNKKEFTIWEPKGTVTLILGLEKD